MPYPIPRGEAQRLEALRSYAIEDTAPEPAFDDLARLAAQICSTPVALVSFVGETEQFFKAVIGLSERSSSREHAFCAHTICEADMLVVRDAQQDPRFADNPLVTGPARIRFYAGVPLRDTSGHAVGSLCVIDHEPRDLTQDQLSGLHRLAGQAAMQLELRRMRLEAATGQEVSQQIERYTRRVLDTAIDGILTLEAVRDGEGAICDFWITQVNLAAAELLGQEVSTLRGRTFGAVVPALLEATMLARLQRVVDHRVPDRFEHFLDAGPICTWLAVAAAPLDDGLALTLAEVSTQKRQELALRTSEEAYRAVFEQSGVGNAVIDIQTHRFLRVNQHLCKVTGYSAEQLLQMTVADLTHPEDRDWCVPLLEQMRSGERDRYSVQKRYVRQDGGVMWVQADATVQRDPAGRPAAIVGVIQDVTAKREQEEQIQRLALVASRTHNGVGIGDARGRIVWVNEAFTQITGYSLEEVVGQKPGHLLQGPDSDPTVVQHMRDRLMAGQGFNVELVNYHKSGSPYWVAIDCQPVFDESRQLQYFVAVQTNITKRKQVEGQLRQIGDAVEAASDGIGIADAMQRTVFMNRALKEMFGWSNDELNAAGGPAVLFVDPTIPPKIEQAVRSGSTWRGDVEMRRRDGAVVLISLRVDPVRDEAGAIIGLIGVHVDVTQQRATERRLANEQARLRSLLESVRDLIFYKDADGTYLGCNSAFCRFVGRLPEQIVGKTDADLFPARLAAFFRERDLLVMEHNTTEGNEEWVAYPNGDAVLLETFKTPLLDSAGQVTGVVGVSRDITHRFEAEQVLRRRDALLAGVARAVSSLLSRRDLQAGLEEALQGVGEGADVDRVYLFEQHHQDGEAVVSQRLEWCRQGVDVQADNPLLQALPWRGGREAWRDALLAGHLVKGTIDELPASERAVLESQQIQSLLIVPVTLDGLFWGFIGFDACREKRRWSDAEVSVLRTLADSIGAAMLRQRDEEALYSSECRFKQITANVPGTVFQFVREGKRVRFTFVSAGIKSLCDVRPEDALGSSEAVTEQVHPDDRPAFERTLQSAMDKDEPWQWEGRFVRRSGEVHWVQATSRVAQRPGRGATWDGLLVDVTPQKIAEAQMQGARRAAEAANRAKSEFLANMSHEIRTPLGAVLGFSDLLRLHPDGDPVERHDWIETICRSGRHLLSLINDVLDLSRIEAGKMEYQKATFALQPLLEEVVGSMKLRARDRQLDLTLEAAEDMPAYVNSDGTRVRQVLVNLVGNAIKFTDRGGIAVLASREVDVEGKPILRVDIEDTGIGIAPDQLERIFESFTQADASPARRFSGTGLGLTISRRICSDLGGSLTVKSQLGMGSVFTLRLPVGAVDASSAAVTAEPKPSAMSGASSVRPPEAGSARVLIVDDVQTNRKLMALILRRAGHEVTAVESGHAALAMLAHTPFNLVLLDMQMPGIDGYSAVRQLRARGVTTPVCAVTAHAMVGDRERCIAAGCDEYLSKPIDRDEMLRVVNQLLAGSRAAA